MIELRVSEAAALSILEQADYYSASADASRARQWEASVEEAILSLMTFPERGARCHFRALTLADLRWIPVAGFSKHLVFYRYTATEQVVLIVQVLHGARDLEAVLASNS